MPRREMVAWAQRSNDEVAAPVGRMETCERAGSTTSYQVAVDVLGDSEPGVTKRVLGWYRRRGLLASLGPVPDGFLAEADGTSEMNDLDLPRSR